jgi:hypothetical protein
MKTIRRGRARLVPRVSAEIAQRLADVCASTNTTETAVVEAALRQHLDGTSDRTLLFRRLDHLGRAVERSHRDLQLLSEAFGVFVQVWFAHTPTLDEEEKKSARRDRSEEAQGMKFKHGRFEVQGPPGHVTAVATARLAVTALALVLGAYLARRHAGLPTSAAISASAPSSPSPPPP